jgi:hypothetical protein
MEVQMDNNVLRKRLCTYKNSEGRLKKVSDEVIVDVLRAWENWSGSTADLYRDLDLSKMQMVTLIKKAKKLVESGKVVESEFKEVEIEQEVESMPSPQITTSCGIELIYKNNVIRFGSSELLMDFLKKVA